MPQPIGGLRFLLALAALSVIGAAALHSPAHAVDDAYRPDDGYSSPGDEEASRPPYKPSGVYREDTRFEPTPVWVRDTRGGHTVKLTVIGVLDPRATFGNGLFTSGAGFADAAVPPPTPDPVAEARPWMVWWRLLTDAPQPGN